MENAEEILQRLDEFSKHKPKTIPKELEDYLCYVARTGDPVYQWSHIKSLFKEKLLSVITDFYETSPGIDIPQCPNVDPFNYDVMKNSLVERIDGFASAPFTVQRICELLTSPRKNYNRIDKFMRAVEKNILVVSTREPGPQRHSESESGEHIDSIVNGSENSEYNVDVEMEDISNWKESNYSSQERAPQASSSDMSMNIDSTPITEKVEEPTETEGNEKNIDSEPKTIESDSASETPHLVQNVESDHITEVCELNNSQSIIESAINITEPNIICEIEPPAAEFLVETNESKSPVQPETDPLAIEETISEENVILNKSSVTTVLVDDTIISPLVLAEPLLEEETQKEAPKSPEMQVDSPSIESIPSEAPSDNSSSSSQSANAETSSDDTVKSEIMLTVCQTDETISTSDEAHVVPIVQVTAVSISDSDPVQIVHNTVEEIASITVSKQGDAIESIADVIDGSSSLQMNLKESPDIQHDTKDVVAETNTQEETLSVPKSIESDTNLLTTDASVE